MLLAPALLGVLAFALERVSLGWVPPLTTLAQIAPALGYASAAAAGLALCLRQNREAAASLAAAALLLLSGYHRADAPGSVLGAPRALRVMTLNLGDKWSEGPALARTLLAEDADVVALEELAPHHVPALAGLAELYPYRLLEPLGIAGVGLLSKTPLDSGEILRDDPDRPALRAALQFDGRQLVVIVVHPRAWLGLLSRFSKDCDALLARAREAAAGAPALLVGDFNTTERSWLYRAIRDLGLANAWESRGEGFGYTFPVFRRYHGVPAPPFLRIDHVFHTPDLVPLAIRVGEPLGSDHLPLICEIAWRPAG